MYSATVFIRVTDFKTMAEGTITAQIGAPTDISPPPYPSPPVFSTADGVTGQSIIVTVPQGYQGSVQLVYQIAQPAYVLIGVAFKNPNGGVGQLEFRSVTINRDPNNSQMVVTDSCAHVGYSVNFSYIILVQHTETGAVGIIDPQLETQTSED